MKNKVWLFTAALLLFTAGCGKTDLTEKEINGDEQKTIESQETEKTTEKDGNASGEKKSVTENENAELQENGIPFWHFEGHGMVSGCCRCKYFRIYR